LYVENAGGSMLERFENADSPVHAQKRGTKNGGE